MGAWGYKLYDDDEAQDARYSYKKLLEQGLDDQAATDEFLKVWRESLDDSDDGPTVWFALADTQWKFGRLEDRVRKQAMTIIDDGSSLARWEEGGPKVVARRQKVLDELKQQLLSPQPPRKVIKVKKPAKIATWSPGELIAYRLYSGRFIVLCLEEIHEGHHARLSALDWIGDAPPEPRSVANLKRKPLDVGRWQPQDRRYTHWHVLALKKSDVPYDRMTRLNSQIALAPASQRFGTVMKWRELDEVIESFFGWK
jgi:hypothetical protein